MGKECGNCGAGVSSVPRCQVTVSGIVYLCGRCVDGIPKEYESEKEDRE